MSLNFLVLVLGIQEFRVSLLKTRLVFYRVIYKVPFIQKVITRVIIVTVFALGHFMRSPICIQLQVL